MSSSRPLAVVTGGARRVGRAICTALAQAHCDIVLTYHSSETEANETVSSLSRLGVTAEAVRVDLSDADDVKSFGESLDRRSRLDLLIHNASIYRQTPVASMMRHEVDEHFAVNALGPALLSQAASPMLARSPLPGGGSIIAMCDIHAMGLPRADFLAYSMSKAALAEMVRTLAVALAPRVRVNGLAPGVIAWPESGPDSDSESQQAYLKRVPLDRAGTPEEAASTIRWLALEATYLTGQIIRLDGGRSLR